MNDTPDAPSISDQLADCLKMGNLGKTVTKEDNLTMLLARIKEANETPLIIHKDDGNAILNEEGIAARLRFIGLGAVLANVYYDGGKEYMQEGRIGFAEKSAPESPKSDQDHHE